VVFNFSGSGDFRKTESFLRNLVRGSFYRQLSAQAEKGVEALRSATPVDSGATAAAWSSRVTISRGQAKIEWTNSNIHEGVPIAVIIQYGHGTGTGGYVVGRDYINPAMRPVFDQITSEVWRAVTSA
jgi:hypothetical protein